MRGFTAGGLNGSCVYKVDLSNDLITTFATNGNEYVALPVVRLVSMTTLVDARNGLLRKCAIENEGSILIPGMNAVNDGT